MVGFIARGASFATPTSTGTQTYTFSGVGVPKAVLVFAVRADTPDTVEAGWSESWGIADGVRERLGCSYSRHSVATSVAKQVGDIDQGVLRLYDPSTGSVVVDATWSQWVTDGVELNFTVVDSSAWLMCVVVFGGDDCECRVGSGAPDDFGGASVQTVDFAADFCLTRHLPSDDGSEVGDAAMSQGIASRSGNKNCCAQTIGADATGDPQQSRRIYRDDVVHVEWDVGSPDSGGNGVLITNWTATGFTVQSDVSGGPVAYPIVAYLAVKTGSGVSVSHDVSETTATSTGAESKTWPGHLPDFTYWVFSSQNTTGKANFGSGGMGVLFGPDLVQSSISVSHRHNSASAETACLFSDDAHANLAHNGTLLTAADVSSIGASGHTFDWSSVAAAGRFYGGLSVSVYVVSGADGQGSLPALTGDGAGVVDGAGVAASRSCLEGSYDTRTALAGSHDVVTSLNGAYDRRTSLAGELQTC